MIRSETPQRRLDRNAVQKFLTIDERARLLTLRGMTPPQRERALWLLIIAPRPQVEEQERLAA